MSTWRDIRETPNFRALDNVRELSSLAIQSQYSASEHMVRLMATFQMQLEITADVDLFYEKFFNIYTAEGVGLDNLGRIVGIERTIEDTSTGAAITLDDDYYRLLLLYKCSANIAASDANSLNYLLAQLVNTGIAGFPRAAYVLEVDVMVIRWVFEDSLNDVQRAVFFAAGTLARGAGVGWELLSVNPRDAFGFANAWQPFNQAPFIADNGLISGVNR